MPDTPIQLPNPEEGELTPSPSFVEKTNKKFEAMDALIYAVVAAVIISAISALIGVSAIIIDQLHFNNQTYREYSENQLEEKETQKKLDELQQQINNLKEQPSPSPSTQ